MKTTLILIAFGFLTRLLGAQTPADGDRKEEVALTDPVAKYLPAKSEMPHCRAVSSRAESRDPMPRAVQGIPRLRSE